MFERFGEIMQSVPLAGIMAVITAGRVEVHHASVGRQTLAELNLIARHHCVVTGVERGSLTIEPRADLRLRRGDVVELVGRRADLRSVASELGRLQPESPETDVGTYVGGVLAGVLLGSIELPLGPYHVGLGMAGGLLLVGAVLGMIRRVGRFQTQVPRPARQLVRDLGIMLFVAETGVRAGMQLESTPVQGAWPWFGLAVCILAAAVTVALVLARRVLHMRPIDAWGSVCGGMTSSAALHTARRASDNQEVAVSYAAAYAVASLLATGAGPLLVRLF